MIQGANDEDKLKCEEFSRKYLIEQAENVKLRNLSEQAAKQHEDDQEIIRAIAETNGQLQEQIEQLTKQNGELQD